MIEMKEDLISALTEGAKSMREADLPENMAAAMERLAEQVGERCVVAVVGQVKAGKSTFVNALLGGDLAKVGTTETTATINYFSHGSPPDPERPVRCHWRGGKATYEDRTFLDSLQGNDIETLRRAAGIERLEYFVNHDLLEDITLVDTPGTNASLDEHQNATAEYMKLHDELRERHNADTEKLGGEADAVIYLTGAVAKTADAKFLAGFKESIGEGASPRNALGVVARVETHPDILARRHDLASDIATKLGDKLNTVIAVGTGVERAMESLLADDGAGLRRIMDTLRRIDPEDIEYLMKRDTIFFNDEDCPVGVAERRSLLEELPEDIRVWPVFATIARVAADRSLDGVERVEAALRGISNFEVFEKTLRRHFIERSHILRCHRIAADAERIVEDIKYVHISRRKMEERRGDDRLARFVSLIRRSGGDPETMAELEDFVRKNLDAKKQVERWEGLHRELGKKFGEFSRDLAGYNADFGALQLLEEPGHGYDGAERAELEALLGLRGPEMEKRLPPEGMNAAYVEGRAFHWQERAQMAQPRSVRRAIAEQAYNRCTSLLASVERQRAG